MNVQCTHCNTVFRVDPARVPAAGVRVRCSICRGVFEVRLDASAAAEAGPPAPAPAPVPEPTSTPVPEPSPAPVGEPAHSPASMPEPTPAPAPVSVPEPEPAPAPQPVAAAPAAPAPRPAGGSPFGSADPSAKARRLARALVSDIVTYHPERRDRALAEGTLKREFMEEIKKSWEEFVAQVGAETARGSSHFRDALNDILAKGQSVF